VLSEEDDHRAASKLMSCHLRRAARAVQNSFAGRVSRSALLTALLPLSFLSLFGTLSAAALFLPTGYDWRVSVISALTSSHENPGGYWLPSIGIMAAMLLVLPFAGYVAQHLNAITPRLARSAGLAFALSFVVMLLAVAAQLAQPVIGLRWLHEFLARTSALVFGLGMLCCCGCALRDRLEWFDGERSLPAAVAVYWLALTLLPFVCLAIIGALMLLGQQGGQLWAEDLRQSFRHTMLWQLAFWEWIGALVAFCFLGGSVFLLPVACTERRRKSDRSSRLAEATTTAYLRSPRMNRFSTGANGGAHD
jgi:hypothetical protein